MDSESLKKEAEESAEKFFGKPTDLVDLDNLRIFKNGYLVSAEPREKRIVELERKLKVETELSNRLGLAYREYEQLTKEQDEHLTELETRCNELFLQTCKQAELIEKMKCCGNCKNGELSAHEEPCPHCQRCFVSADVTDQENVSDKWELAND